MKHPLLLILGGEEFRTPELERALQRKGWSLRWVDSANSAAIREMNLDANVLIVNSGQGNAPISSIHTLRNNNPLLPLILVGENAAGFSMHVDACIPYGAVPDVWLTTLKPFWPIVTPTQETTREEEYEVFGKFRLVKKIATGGMADIFKAEQLEPHGFKRVLAIKRLLPKHQMNPIYTEMLFNEANLGARLSHQNIISIFDLGLESGAYYIAMEYVDGGNLRSLIDNAIELNITFPEPIAAFITLQVAEALDYAHRRRDDDGKPMDLVHRDICPQNILVSREGTVKVIDFGIARVTSLMSGQTQKNTLHGKPQYMSPEQAMRTAIDKRSDIFSLGLVLFELLTLQKCFHSENEQGLLESVRRGIVRDIKIFKPDISKPMARIVEKVLQKNLSSRYSSAYSLSQDLKAYLEHLYLQSIEKDITAIVKMLLVAHPQVKAFIASRYNQIKSDIVLPSEVDKRQIAERSGKGKRIRPVWILPVVNVLLVLLAWLIWKSMNI